MTSPLLTPATLTAQLSLLSAGHRAWFWLCTAAPRPVPPLLLQPLSLASAQVGLHEQLAGLPPLRARPVVGLASVGADGRLTLGGPGMHRPMLTHLARWVSATHPRYPQLARLKDTVLLDIAPDGLVLARHEDPALWTGLPEALVADTLAQTRRNLGRMKPKRRYWFWAVADGPDGQPFLSISPMSRDPDGVQLAEKVQRLRRRGGGEGIHGTLHRPPSGQLVFTTRHPLPALAELLTSLAASDDLPELDAPVLLQTADGSVIDTLHLRAPDA